MYITEISYSDFKKLGLIGYRHEKVNSEDGKYWHVECVPVHDIVTEGDVEYSKSFEHELIAVFINQCEHQDAEDNIVWNKYYVNMPATYCIWCGVKHVYSQKGRWFIEADSENGTLSKKEFSKVYLIHVED